MMNSPRLTGIWIIFSNLIQVGDVLWGFLILIGIIIYINYFSPWFKESPTDVVSVTTQLQTKSEKSEPPDLESLFSTFKSVDTVLVPLMIAAHVERESTALLNLDLITTRDSLRKTRLSADPTVESFVEDVLKLESSEPSSSRKSRSSRKASKSPKNDHLLFKYQSIISKSST